MFKTQFEYLSDEDRKALEKDLRQYAKDREVREVAALTETCKKLRPTNGWPDEAGFTIGMTVVPGVVSPQFKEKLRIYGGWPDESWDALWQVDPAGDPMTAWLLSERPLSLWERCKVGWQLWRDEVARFPWPVKQTAKQ